MNNLRKNQAAAAAVLALKAHVLASNPRILAETDKGSESLRAVEGSVSLTEAPEDAVCSLVIDLMGYCEQEEIDWTQDIMVRASQYYRRAQRRDVKTP
jgi:hypothetical protein